LWRPVEPACGHQKNLRVGLAVAHIFTGGESAEKVLDAQLTQHQLDIGQGSGTAHRHGYAFGV